MEEIISKQILLMTANINNTICCTDTSLFNYKTGSATHKALVSEIHVEVKTTKICKSMTVGFVFLERVSILQTCAFSSNGLSMNTGNLVVTDMLHSLCKIMTIERDKTNLTDMISTHFGQCRTKSG